MSDEADRLEDFDRCHVCNKGGFGDPTIYIYDCRRCGEPTCGRDSCGDYDYSEDRGSVVVCRLCLGKRTAPTSSSGVGGSSDGA